MASPFQLLLPLERDALQLRRYFERRCASPISLTITDNSTSILSVKDRGGTVFIRLHRMFLCAGEEVLHEIAAFLRRRKGPTPLLRGFLSQNTHRIREARPRKRTLRPRGNHHDLGAIYDSLNAEYFGSSLSCTLTWGTKGPGHAVRKRTLGSYSRHTNTIRINPVLDRKAVPRYFVEFVVFHEMLHSDTAIHEKNGRRQVHSKQFRQREKLFRHYDRALAWEKGKGF